MNAINAMKLFVIHEYHANDELRIANCARSLIIA